MTQNTTWFQIQYLVCSVIKFVPLFKMSFYEPLNDVTL